MARTSFARTVILTFCEAEYVTQTNDVKKGLIKLFGDYDLEHAQNAVKRQLNAKGVIVKKVSHVSYYGTMSMEEFAQNCVKTKFKEW